VTFTTWRGSATEAALRLVRWEGNDHQPDGEAR
jgi:hypothetical protein